VIHVLWCRTGRILSALLCWLVKCAAYYPMGCTIRKCRFCFSRSEVRRLSLSSRAAADWRRWVSLLPSWRLGLLPFFLVIFLVILSKRLLTILNFVTWISLMFVADVWFGLEILEISSAVGLCIGAKEIALGRFRRLARRVSATLCASRPSVDCCESAALFVASFRCGPFA
jgi:hypothetical protein